MERDGRHISEEEQKELLRSIQAQYDAQMSPYYGAARLWIDGIIDPVETRDVISHCIQICDNNPDIPRFNPGVIQT
jgi:acetyl-CoA carboxylase carboxyltransferase component